mmetsp:Transcript_43359/g.94429  ORF Transcript_43359/g.94429 Transcript_43359/m.94429 type:complete len:285 (+) Transcript_43359:1-855(+)
MLVDMGIPELRAREALKACGDDLERAVERATAPEQDEAAAHLASGASAPSSSLSEQSRESKVSMLVDMGIPEPRAREALKACGDDLERAVDRATVPVQDEAVRKLLLVMKSLDGIDADLAALESQGSSAEALEPSDRVKRLRGFSEAVTVASCDLDAVDICGEEELRTQRRAGLKRCDVLERRIALQQQGAEAAETLPVSSVEQADEVVEKAHPPPSSPSPLVEPSLGDPSDSAQEGPEQAPRSAEEALSFDGDDVDVLSNGAAAERKLCDSEAAAHTDAAREL